MVAEIVAEPPTHCAALTVSGPVTDAGAFTVIVNVEAALLLAHPFAFFTVMVPVYVPGAVFAGTSIVMALAGKEASVTAAKLLAGDAFHAMLYVVGVFDTAL